MRNESPASWQMCPNPDCARCRQATKLKGGCECGTAFVPYLPKDQLTLHEMAVLVSAFSTAEPDLPNLSVEEVERELTAMPGLQRRLQERVGRSEAEGGELREVLRMVAGGSR